MKRAYRRWVCGLLAGVLAMLALCAAVVYVVDPCLYYRIPDRWQPVFSASATRWRAWPGTWRRTPC